MMHRQAPIASLRLQWREVASSNRRVRHPMFA